MSILSFGVFPFLLCWLLLRALLHPSLSGVAIDQPNHRSLHTVPIPRTGGLAIMFATMAGWLMVPEGWTWPLLTSVIALVGLSLADDIRGLSAAWRFVGHCVVSAGFLAASFADLPWWMLALLLLATVWMINLYNFMDGSDGLAGGMAVFGFGSYGFAAWLAGDFALAGVCFVIAAAASGFLLLNFHPARIFMGDAGSIPLGFLAAALGGLGWQRALWPLWFPLLVFSPFVVDATVTLLRRILRRERIWEAHRSHYYQRLVQMGWGHRKTALVEYTLMLGVGVSAVALLSQPDQIQLAGLLGWGLVYAFLAMAIDRRWRNQC